MNRSIALAALATATLACAPAPAPSTSTIDLGAVTRGQALLGVSTHGADLDVLVEGRGLLTVTRAGELVSERVPGENGLWDVRYNDVAHLGDDVFVLLADPEGYLYDARTQQQRVHFCVEPGFEPEPGEPVEPVVTQRNDAVAASGNLIVAAPRFYEGDALVESTLRTYLAGDGAPIASVDLEGLELRGLALRGDEILGVENDTLHVFTEAGERVEALPLEGTESASGVAVDGDSVLVADERAGVVRVYELE